MVLSNTHATPVFFPIITYRYESFFSFDNVFVSVACVTACAQACRCIFAVSLGGPDVWLEFPGALKLGVRNISSSMEASVLCAEQRLFLSGVCEFLNELYACNHYIRGKEQAVVAANEHRKWRGR